MLSTSAKRSMQKPAGAGVTRTLNVYLNVVMALWASPDGRPTASTNLEPETTPLSTYFVSFVSLMSALIAAFAPALSPACEAKAVTGMGRKHSDQRQAFPGEIRERESEAHKGKD